MAKPRLDNPEALAGAGEAGEAGGSATPGVGATNRPVSSGISEAALQSAASPQLFRAFLIQCG
jgi:hypothetical protein